MASAGKVIAAGVAANTELTAALATLNFDFSLVKVEAPIEFAGVGASLTKKRKADAEDGLSHSTARKLAALFSGELPDSHALFGAYGKRASEIAGSPSFNPKGSAAEGPFAAHVGAEATTIWAAATSGKEAIAIHLLGCLLARIWPAGEAVSIWMDLTAQRKARIRDEAEQATSMNLSSVYAARVELSRAQLTDWDAGIRAWLRVADRAREKQQTQLRLIVDNIALPVASRPSIYEAVVEVWKGSMVLMNDLILGKPQRVESGALILGLSAWHLYPNMSVLSSANPFINQKDPLVSPGGIVTIGLQDRPGSVGPGVHWSLPLSHMKYYGQPEIKTRYSGTGETRVSFEHFLYVAAGSIFSTWRVGRLDLEFCMTLLGLIAERLVHIAPWLSLFKKLCESYKSIDLREKSLPNRLIALGAKHSYEMLDLPECHPPPAFGLTRLPVLLTLCKDTNSRIKLLRKWAESRRQYLQNAVIRYLVPGDTENEHYLFLFPASDRKRKRAIADEHHWRSFKGRYGGSNSSRIRAQQLAQSIHEVEARRIQGMVKTHKHRSSLNSGFPLDMDQQLPTSSTEDHQYVTLDVLDFVDRSESEPENEMASESTLKQSADSVPFDPVKRDQTQYARYAASIDRTKETPGPFGGTVANSVLLNEHDLFGDDEGIQFDTNATYYIPRNNQILPYRFVAGETRTAAIFVPLGITEATRRPRNEVSVALLYDVLKENELLTDHHAMLRTYWLTSALAMGKATGYEKSLSALQRISKVYENIPDAQIDLQARKRPLYACHFAAHEAVSEWNTLDVVFSCIAYLETGITDIAPNELQNTLAICYQDSIYVAECLLRDPAELQGLEVSSVKRIIGNIGKPGLCILQAPAAPEVREYDPLQSWHVVNHHEFDGRYEDNFASTSLHLSFTGSVVPHNSYSSSQCVQGSVHRDVHYVETLIQAHDTNGWIADLDIISAMKNFRFGWDADSYDEGQNRIIKRLVRADCWSEILDQPEEDCVIRANGNWTARLTAATILWQLGRNFSIIMPANEPKYAAGAQSDTHATRKNDQTSQDLCIHKRAETPDFNAHEEHDMADCNAAMSVYNFSPEDSDVSSEDSDFFVDASDQNQANASSLSAKVLSEKSEYSDEEQDNPKIRPFLSKMYIC